MFEKTVPFKNKFTFAIGMWKHYSSQLKNFAVKNVYLIESKVLNHNETTSLIKMTMQFDRYPKTMKSKTGVARCSGR